MGYFYTYIIINEYKIYKLITIAIDVILFLYYIFINVIKLQGDYLSYIN